MEEVDGLCAGDVTQAFFTMLREAQIDVYLQGVDAHMAAEKLRAALDGVQRAPRPLAPACAMPHVREQRFSEPVDAVQGKLCLLFTAGTPLAAAQLSAMRVAVALLGGTTTSRLFVNVREKQSLCYYCAASYSAMTGLLCIDSGIEHENAARAKAAILHELEALRTGEIGEEELAAAKRYLRTQLNAVADSQGGAEAWQRMARLRGDGKTPRQVLAEVMAVTQADVHSVLAGLTLSVSYVLTKGGAADGE